MKALRQLLANEKADRPKWVKGRIPYHYKRINITPKEALRLAAIGQSKISSYFGDKLYFTQAVIAGGCLSGDYDTVIIVSPSQYGKSWLMGRIVPIRAYENKSECYIAGGDTDKTVIIQNYLFRALQDSAPEIKNNLNSESKDKLDKLATSVSKTKISFTEGGSIEPLSLGESYKGNLSRNKAVGRGGDYFVDEAALLSDDTYGELGRRDFKDKSGAKGLQVLISNPHNPGIFMDKLTDDDPPDRTLIIWMDILTAIEEGTTTAYDVLHSDFAKHKSTRRRYLMCELETTEDSMFGTPKVFRETSGEYKQYFVGIDPAYKGKDSIEIGIVSLDENRMVRVEEIETLDKTTWIDGATSEDIIRASAKIARHYDAAMTCVDVGWGVWLVEGLVKRHIACRGINFGSAPTPQRVRSNDYAAVSAQRKRDEMHIDLQTLIDDEAIEFSEQAWEKVKDIFPFVTCERNSSGKIQVRKKSEIRKSIGHSPDTLDALLLAIQAMMLSLIGTPHYIT